MHPVIWLALDPNNQNRMYASVIHSTLGGIFVSSNIQNGSSSTWTKLINPPRTEGHPFNIKVLNDGTLLASYSGRRNSSGVFTASSGIFISTNGGTSWTDRSHTGMHYWTKTLLWTLTMQHKVLGTAAFQRMGRSAERAWRIVPHD
ncbi:MAG: hypothetical protein IPG02_17475 [Ignavibacteria bacterium]|nr:hypothetical protein [Ignavibacteria bacterium]